MQGGLRDKLEMNEEYSTVIYLVAHQQRQYEYKWTQEKKNI